MLKRLAPKGDLFFLHYLDVLPPDGGDQFMQSLPARRRDNMTDPAEANETYRVASAIAAFDAIQVAFAALVKKGILSKVEAEQILSRQSRPSRPAVPAIKPPNC